MNNSWVLSMYMIKKRLEIFGVICYNIIIDKCGAFQMKTTIVMSVPSEGRI